MKKFDKTPYNLHPPPPAHIPAEKRPLQEKSMSFSRDDQISGPRAVPEPPPTPEHQPMQIPEPPLQIPEPPLQIPEPVQIHFPELNTLEPTLTDAASLDQLMSFVLGEEPAPSAYTQEREPQVLHMVQSLSDEKIILSHSRMILKGSWNGLGAKLVGSVSTSHHYHLWKSGSVAERITHCESESILTPFFLKTTMAYMFLVLLENSHRAYESFASDEGSRNRLKVLSSGSFSISPSLGGVSV
ncbi:hypothetical protein TNCV_3789861 [Trichonephila clavipes]|nr:hypothetical protein TNCV_3789861 [Trichonephila clavipes]